MTPRWDDPELAVDSDSKRTARYRRLQSLWRETVVGLPPGQDSKGNSIGSWLPEASDGQWLTPVIAAYVENPVPQALRDGEAIEQKRLRDQSDVEPTLVLRHLWPVRCSARVRRPSPLADPGYCGVAVAPCRHVSGMTERGAALSPSEFAQPPVIDAEGVTDPSWTTVRRTCFTTPWSL